MLAHRMALTIDLDDQPGCRAIKIHDAPADRMLAPELEALRSVSKYLPQHPFRQGHTAPHRPGPQTTCVLFTRRRHLPLHHPWMVPLPAASRQGGTLLIVARRLSPPAAARLVLGRRRRGRCEFSGG